MPGQISVISFSPSTVIKSADMNSNFTTVVSTLNQASAILQQVSGGQEKGGYYITGNGSNGASLGTWIGSLSRGTNPVSGTSITLDTSMQTPSFCNSPSVDHLTANGFHVFTQMTATQLAANVGGLYTIQY